MVYNDQAEATNQAQSKLAGSLPSGGFIRLLPLMDKVCLLPHCPAILTHFIWREKTTRQNVFCQYRHRRKGVVEVNPNCYAVILLRLSNVWKSC
jgi:hypothetical protein